MSIGRKAANFPKLVRVHLILKAMLCIKWMPFLRKLFFHRIDRYISKYQFQFLLLWVLPFDLLHRQNFCKGFSDHKDQVSVLQGDRGVVTIAWYTTISEALVCILLVIRHGYKPITLILLLFLICPKDTNLFCWILFYVAPIYRSYGSFSSYWWT
jgi:hypothetical protein